jgi:CheY-like chemotaxis protein
MSHSALVVDDDPASRLIYQQILTPLGFEVEVAGDGATAVEFLSQGAYDIVFLDMLLPQLSGADVFAYIRQATHLRKTCVIIISAHRHFMEHLLLSNCDRYLVKPVSLKDVRDAVSNALESIKN